MRDLLRSEWTKLRSVRSTWLTVAGTVAAGIALSVLGVSDVLGQQPAELPAGWDPTAVSLKGFLFAQLLIGMLGALSVTSEYATGMIGTSLTAVPSRSRLLTAKTLVVAAVALGTALATTLISFGLVQALLGGAGLPNAGPGDPGVFRALAVATLYLTVISLAGLFIGTVTRSTTSSLGVLVGALLLVPAIGPGLPGALGDFFGRFWPVTAGQAAYTVVRAADSVTPVAGVLVLVTAVAAVGVAGHLLLRTRDV